MIEAGIKIQGYEEAKKAQEDTKNQIEDLKKEYGKDNVSTDFFNLPDEALKSLKDKIVDIKQDLLQNRDCANLIPKLETIEQICRELLK